MTPLTESVAPLTVPPTVPVTPPTVSVTPLTGPAEDDHRADGEVRIRNAVQTEEALKWGRVSAGSLWGFMGRAADHR